MLNSMQRVCIVVAALAFGVLTTGGVALAATAGVTPDVATATHLTPHGCHAGCM